MKKISTSTRIITSRTFFSGALWLLSFFAISGVAHAQTKLISWDVAGITNYGVSPLAPTTVNTNLENIVGFTRGSGLSTGTGGVTGGWGATNWADTQANAIADDDVIYFGFKPKAGFALSLTKIDPFSYRRSGTGPQEGRIQYTLDAGANYSGISQGVIAFGSSSSSGAGVTPTINLSSDVDLQEVSSNAIGLRIVPFGATSAAGTFYIFDVNSGADFSIDGRILGTTETALALAACKNIVGTAKTFTVKGDGLTTGNITITAPTDFEISTDDISYSASLTLTPASGSVNQQYYVRLKSGLANGSYTGNVTVTGGGFTATANIGVALTGTVNPLPTAFVNSVSPICAGGTFPFVNIDLTGASPWTLTYSDGTSSTEETGVVSTMFSVQSTADGEVFTATALTDANGCVALAADLTGSATVVVNPLPEVSVVATSGAISGAAGVYNQGETVSITATVDVGAGVFSWTGPDGFTAGDVATITVASATSAKSGTYTVTATDANLCVGTADVEVVVYDNTIYVSTTGDDTNTGSAASPLKTIQKAVDVAVATNTIEVAAGIYAEKINVNKAVTIKGANFGTSGCSGSRATEAEIAGDGTNNASVTITADGVTFDGFRVDGFSGISTNGFKDISLSNNLVEVASIGINAGTVATSAGNTISIYDNCINLDAQIDAITPQSTIGIFLNSAAGSEPLVVSGNNVNGAFYGYLVHNLNTTPVTIINGGEITGVMQGIAAVNTLNGTNLFPSSFDIDGTTMSGFTGSYPTTPAINSHAGLYTFTGGASTLANALTVNVRNTNIQGTGKPDAASAGINVSDFSTGTAIVQNVTVDKSVISNNSNRGVNARGRVILNVTNSTLEGNGNDAIASDGNDGFAIIARNNSQIIASNNFIKHPATSATPVTAFSIAAGTNLITANNNSVLMNGNANGKGTLGTSGTINATCNWWGGIAGTVTPLMSGNTNFELFLVDGTDNDASTAGFQPVPNSCKGCSSGLSVENGVGKFFCTIQEAIDDASTLNGQTLIVGAGTYNESVTVTKSLTILGPNSAISPNSGTRVGEAIITNLANGRAFSIQNGNTDVIISGFKFDGGSPIHDGNETGFPNTSDVTFSKNLVVNANQIYAGTSTSWADLVITDNKFEDINATATSNAMQVSHTLTTTITDNTFTNVNYAAMAIDATPTVNISGNTIDGTGFQAIQLAGAIGDATIENNKINDANRVAQAADRGAIRLYGSGFTGVIAVSNNEITGGYNGITVRNGENITGENITITDNSITGLTSGKAIYHGGIGVLNATCNWFGTVDPAAIDAQVTGDVNFLPFGTNGTDDQPTNTGFQPVAGSCEGVGPVKNVDTNETFLTIQSAINDADTDNGDVIEVAFGTYDEQVIVNKEVKIKGLGVMKPIINFTGTVAVPARKTLFDVTANNVEIDNLQFDVDLSKLHSAILASASGLTKVTVTNNDILPYHSVTDSYTSGYGDRNAININHGNFRIGSTNVNDITITGNKVGATVAGPFLGDGAGDIGFRSAVSMDAGAGTFSNNDFQSINHDVLVRFNSNDAVTIDNNMFKGGGVQLSDQNAGVGTFSVTNNTFDGSTTGSVMRLQNNQNGRTTVVSGNTFNNLRWGVSLENYKNVSFGNNIFNALAGETDFNHIVVNTKSNSSNSNAIVQTTIDGSFTNNTFNSLGSDVGTAMLFLNQDSDNASFGTFVIGSEGNENTFNSGFANFIKLGNEIGSSATSTFPTYLGTGGWVTTMACWNKDLIANFNKFDVGSGAKLSDDLTAAERTTLEGKVFHKPDDACLAKVDYFLPIKNITQNTAHVNFTTAIAAANANDVLEALPGAYTENPVINKPLTINGANATIDPNTGTRGDESILSGTFKLQSSDITIDGFEITGTGRAVESVGTGPWSDITIMNNRMVSNTGQQAVLNGFGVVTNTIGATNWNIKNNFISDLQSINATILVLFNIDGLNIDDNLIEHKNESFTGRRGLNIDGGDNVNIRRNSIDLGLSNPASDNSDGAFTKSAYNLQLSSGAKATTNIYVDSNTMKGSYDGIITLGNGNFTNVELINNKISDVVLGIRFQAGTNTNPGEHKDFIIANNDISSANRSIYLQNGGVGTMDAYNNISITENSLLRTVTGIALQVQADAIVTASSITANCNWFGVTSSQDVATKVSGEVAYASWLIDGTDDQLTTTGFQPVPGSCTGSAITIASITPSPQLCETAGSAVVTFSGGTSPIDISWTDGGANSGSATGVTSPYTITNLVAAAYTVTLTDANSSATDQAVTIEYLPVSNITSGNNYATIQAAIDDASASDVIEVCAGSYAENVIVSKSVTLNGANVDITCDGSRAAESIVSVTSGIPFNITASNVTINGFEITAPASRNAVVIGNVSNATVTFNKIHDIGTTFTGGNVHAIVHIVPSTPVSNLTISDNCISDVSSTLLTGFSSSAIGILQSTSSGVLTGLNIERNVIDNVTVNDGNWPTGKIAYGVQVNVGGGSNYLTNTGKVLNAKINNNEITNLSGHIATAIGLEGNTEDAEVKNNKVASLSSTKSADRAGGGYDLNGLKFENNRFVSTITVEDNSFATSTFSNNGNANLGYAVVNYVPSSTATLGCNWFGTAISNDIEDKADLSGKLLSKVGADIAFEPYLTSGGDGAGVGFQPTGNCDGSTITIVSITPSPQLCETAGSAVITFSGGIAPYDISWTDNGGANSGSAMGVTSPYTITNLVAAAYTVTLTDANTSTTDQAVTIEYLPVSNITSGNNYATIQAAIDDASANDVIEVCDGSYTETLTVNKAVTINGANAGTAGTATRIDESVLLNSKVTISGSGAVVFDGFKFLRDDAVTGDVLLVGNTPTTITNNIFERNGSTTGTNIRAIVTASGNAVKTISNNLFTGDISGGLFSGHKTWNNGIYVNGVTGTVTIQNNTFENNRTAINVDEYQANITLEGNTLTNNGTHIAIGGSTPPMGNFTLAANDFQASGSAIFNLSNVAEAFRLDVTSSTYKGITLATATDADLFEFESQLFHKDRSGRKGKVIYKANSQFVNNITTPFTKIDVIQNSVKYADTNDTINLQGGTYNQRVIIDKSDLTLQGVEADETLYILDGTGLTGNGDGVQLANGAKNVAVKQLTIQNFSGASGNTDAGIYAIGGNDGLEVDDVVIKNNVGGSGIYANGPIDGVTITDSKIEGHTIGARGIVVWNGFKQNITITGNTLTNNSCCGIELQDGTASAVNISNNIIDIGTGDNAIGLTSLNELTGANLIDNNTITGGGRYGIEVKNPAGGVTVSNNSVTLTTQNADLRDRAGIAVFRRGFLVGQGYANIPNGVTVTGNTVTGYQQTSDSEGFGIVVEGTNHTVSNNILESNDIGIQQQAGHSPYTADAAGDGDQSNLADLYFGRGNSPELCNVTLTGNTYTSNGVDERIVIGGGTGSIVNEVTPTVDDPTDVEVCNGETITAIVFTGNNLPGVVYNWTNDNTNIGLAATGTGDITSYIAANTTAVTITATIIVTPTVNGCDGTPQEFTITINPTPTATIAGDATVCLDDTEPQITFTGGAGEEPYTFTYTVDGGSPQTVSSTSGNTATLNVPTTTAGTFSYELTQVSSANTCSVAITGQTTTVIVNDKAMVEAGTYTAICQSGSVPLTGSFSGAAASITWSDGNIGGAFSPSANDPAAIYTPPANFTGTITLTITSADPAGPCPAAIATASLVVNPNPTVVITPVMPFCEGGTLSLSATVNGATTYAWSGPNGFTSADANPSIPNATAAASGTYTLIVTSADLCTATATTTVTVYPLPTAPVITSDNAQVCKGTNAVLSASCAVATDIFRWTTPPINQGNVSGVLPNSGTQIVAAPGVYTGYCESTNGCVGPNGSITITEGTNCNGGGFIVVTPELPFICPGASIQLTAAGCATGTVSWTAVSGTVSGATVTLSPAATTTYLVTCSTGGSTSIDVRVAQPNVTVTNNISTGKSVVKAVNTIESDKRVGSPNVTPAPNVIYEAGNSILLKPGFVAEGTAVFKAEIKVCN